MRPARFDSAMRPNLRSVISHLAGCALRYDFRRLGTEINPCVLRTVKLILQHYHFRRENWLACAGCTMWELISSHLRESILAACPNGSQFLLAVHWEINSSGLCSVKFPQLLPHFFFTGAIMKEVTNKPAKAGFISTQNLLGKIGSLQPQQNIQTKNGGIDCVISTYNIE